MGGAHESDGTRRSREEVIVGRRTPRRTRRQRLPRAHSRHNDTFLSPRCLNPLVSWGFDSVARKEALAALRKSRPARQAEKVLVRVCAPHIGTALVQVSRVRVRVVAPQANCLCTRFKRRSRFGASWLGFGSGDFFLFFYFGPGIQKPITQLPINPHRHRHRHHQLRTRRTSRNRNVGAIAPPHPSPPWHPHPKAHPPLRTHLFKRDGNWQTTHRCRFFYVK